MNGYDENCERCQSNTHVIIEPEIFYKGFVIRKHYNPTDPVNYVVCARSTEGESRKILAGIVLFTHRQFSQYRKMAYGECNCHPHESVAAINGTERTLEEDEYALKKGIDEIRKAFFGD